MKLPLPQPDKLAHYLYGSLITVISAIILGAVWKGLIICIIAAGAKEFYDNFHPNHESSLDDILWTMYGGIVVTIPYWGFIPT